MGKMILRLKIFHLSTRTITLLLATLWITIGTQLASHADTSQSLLSEDALKDPGSLAVKLQDTRAVISQHIATQLSAETQQLLGKYDGISSPSLALQRALILDLNKMLQAGPLYDAESFADLELSEQTNELLAQNPQSGEGLVRLNRLLFSDAYSHEVASPTEKQTENPEGIERCRENLRRIQQAREKYRDETHRDPQWLSELAPEYLDKKDLLCPADATNGKPGVLISCAEDPTLPCSYLYEFRPSQKSNRKIILANEGDMLPFVRCEHHRLNLSVGGKLYRNGSQRGIYKDKMKVAVAAQINASGDLYAQLKAQLGEDFLKSPEGKELLEKVYASVPPSTTSIRQQQMSAIGKPMPTMRWTDLSGKPVELETFQSEFILVNIFPITSDTCGPKLQRLEKLLKNYDVSQLQIVGVSTDDSAEAIETFKEKYGLSMPIWIGKNMQMQISADNGTTKSQAQLTTFLLNRELIIKDMVIDFDPDILSQKFKQFVESKD